MHACLLRVQLSVAQPLKRQARHIAASRNRRTPCLARLDVANADLSDATPRVIPYGGRLPSLQVPSVEHMPCMSVSTQWRGKRISVAQPLVEYRHLKTPNPRIAHNGLATGKVEWRWLKMRRSGVQALWSGRP